MPTTSDGGFRGRLVGPAALVTHLSIWIGLLLTLPSTIFYLLHPMTPLPLTWWGIGPSFLATPMWFAIAFHDYHAMCVRCMKEVPVDAELRATREGGWDRRMLHYYHLYNWKAILAMVLIVSVLGGATGLFAVGLVWNVATVLLLAAWRYHRLLRPWCPWCPRWGGGGNIETRVPDPDPSMEKTQ